MSSVLPRLSALACLLPVFAAAQVDYAKPGVPYVQDFNHPDAARPALLDWRDNQTFPGWFAAFFDSNRTAYSTPERLLATSGQGRNEIAFYLYRQDAANPEAALGTQPSDEKAPGVGSGGIFYGVALVNRTGAPLTSLRLSYRVELWRIAVTEAAHSTLSVGARVGGKSLIDGAWTLLPGGVYTTPFGGPGQGAPARSVDGNAPENIVRFEDLRLDGLNLPPGETLWLRWFDVNNRLADHGVGLDDVSITLLP